MFIIFTVTTDLFYCCICLINLNWYVCLSCSFHDTFKLYHLIHLFKMEDGSVWGCVHQHGGWHFYKKKNTWDYLVMVTNTVGRVILMEQNSRHTPPKWDGAMTTADLGISSAFRGVGVTIKVLLRPVNGAEGKQWGENNRLLLSSHCTQ